LLLKIGEVLLKVEARVHSGRAMSTNFLNGFVRHVCDDHPQNQCDAGFSLRTIGAQVADSLSKNTSESCGVIIVTSAGRR